MEGLLCASSFDLEVAAATRAFNCAMRSVVALGAEAEPAAGGREGAAGPFFPSLFFSSSAFARAAAS